MLIDPNAAKGPVPTLQVLAPELAHILAELKLQVGQRVEATVVRAVPVTDAEREQLLIQQQAAKPSAGQRTLQAVLRDPEVKLVELMIRSQLVPALTNLPLPRDIPVQVLVTPRGLLILPPNTPPSAPPVDEAKSHTAAGEPGSVRSTRPPPTPTGGPAMEPPAGKEPLDGNSAPSAAARQTGLRSPANPLLQPNQHLSPPSSSGEIVHVVSKGARALRPLLAEAAAQALPVAQPVKPLLEAIDRALPLLKTHPASEGSPLHPLVKLFTQIQGTSLDLSTLKPGQADPLKQAVLRSGVFYEPRFANEHHHPTDNIRPATSKSPLPDNDLKGLLVQLSQWAGAQLSAPLVQTNGGQSALEQLLMNLAYLFNPKGRRSEGGAAKQLAEAIQQRVEKHLAQIQLQQNRTLGSQIADPTTPTQWHLDVPVRLPDGYGNLYLNFFEPRVLPEQQKDKDQKRKAAERAARWRVFLQLELDQLGELAAEISVQNNNIEATLWAERPELRERASKQLQQLKDELEAQGMVVTDLRCSQSPPPEQKIQLDYALIDVKT